MDSKITSGKMDSSKNNSSKIVILLSMARPSQSPVLIELKSSGVGQNLNVANKER